MQKVANDVSAMLETLGEWVDIYSEALYLPRPAGIAIEEKEKNFILKGESGYYFFSHQLGMKGSVDVEVEKSMPEHNNVFHLPQKVKSIKWLDNGEDVFFTQEGDRVTLITVPQLYGENLVVKIAKIEV